MFKTSIFTTNNQHTQLIKWTCN